MSAEGSEAQANEQLVSFPLNPIQSTSFRCITVDNTTVTHLQLLAGFYLLQTTQLLLFHSAGFKRLHLTIVVFLCSLLGIQG